MEKLAILLVLLIINYQTCVMGMEHNVSLSSPEENSTKSVEIEFSPRDFWENRLEVNKFFNESISKIEKKLKDQKFHVEEDLKNNIEHYLREMAWKHIKEFYEKNKLTFLSEEQFHQSVDGRRKDPLDTPLLNCWLNINPEALKSFQLIMIPQIVLMHKVIKK
jgi:hypothetical protein